MQTVISARETAELLGVSCSSITKRIHDGRLHAVKVGRTWCIDFSDIKSCTDLPRPTPQRAAKKYKSQ